MVLIRNGAHGVSRRPSPARSSARLVPVLLVVVSVLTAGFVAASSKGSSADPLGQIAEYPVPSASSHPVDIVAGPDGNLWFTENSANQIGKMTPSGVITEYPIPTSASAPLGITAGPDGNLWFTEAAVAKIAKITTAGAVTEYTLPPNFQTPSYITAGSDGNLWFTLEGGSDAGVGNVTTSGTFTMYSLPNANPRGIAAGPDSNLWFVENSGPGGSHIVKMTTSGTMTPYLNPTPSLLNGITAGPDGSMWFAEAAGKIGRITMTGAVSDYDIPSEASDSHGSNPTGVASDGHALWFTESFADKVGTIDPTSHHISEYAVPTSGSSPLSIASGPSNAVWFTENDGNKIAKVGTELGPSGEYTPLTPTRILDTRNGTGGHSGPLGAERVVRRADHRPGWRAGIGSVSCGVERDRDGDDRSELPDGLADRDDARTAVEPELRARSDRPEPGHCRRGIRRQGQRLQQRRIDAGHLRRRRLLRRPDRQLW